MIFRSLSAFSVCQPGHSGFRPTLEGNSPHLVVAFVLAEATSLYITSAACLIVALPKLCMAVQFASHEWCLSQVPCQPSRRNSKMFVSHGILQGSPGSKVREFEVESDSITFPAR